MKTNSLYITIIGITALICLVVISCKEQDDPIIDGLSCLTSTLGDTNCFTVTPISQLIEGDYNYPQSDSFDIDFDGDFDIQFRCNEPGSPGGGIQKIAEVRCLSSDTEISTIQIPDTVFMNVDYDTIASPPSIFERLTRTCQRWSSVDSVLYSGIRYVLDTTLNDETDIMEISNWHSATVSFAGSLFGSNPQWINEQNDTAFYVSHLYFTDCYNLPDDQSFYLGIKTVNNATNGIQYGWIRFHVYQQIKFSITDMGLYKDAP